MKPFRLLLGAIFLSAATFALAGAPETASAEASYTETAEAASFEVSHAETAEAVCGVRACAGQWVIGLAPDEPPQAATPQETYDEALPSDNRLQIRAPERMAFAWEVCAFSRRDVDPPGLHV